MPVRTIEWLTDNSDVIFVARVEPDSRLTNGRILRVLKGDHRTLTQPLGFSKFDGYHYYAPIASGPIRLRFVRGTSELLHEIDLARSQITDDFPTLHRILFGIDQYGELLRSQKDLLDRVVSRLKVGAGDALPVHSVWPHARERSGVEAPQDFPLETNGVTYVLIVPFTEERRDHFLEVLRTGNAIERQRAIHELKQFDDKKAYDAIRAAASDENVTRAFRYNQDGESIVASSVVRTVARQAIRRINE
jgi:hypothetical protein